VIGMQNENTIHGAHQHVVDLVLFARIAKHHSHEVGGVAEFILGVNIGCANAILVSHGHQGWHFGNQTDCRNVTLVFVQQVH